jgi:carboxymethylenebutenolidase
MIRAESPETEIRQSTGSFESQGKAIAVETFEPTTPGRHPAILVLHGAGGMDIGGPQFREFARELARRGYVAHIVHYFDQTGTVRADTPAIGRSFSTWMLTIGDALTAIAKQDNVDPDRLGLLGFSLGSYLSLSVASHDRRVSAVVEYFGGLPDVFAWNLKRFPPTLILHGDADPVVPVAEARKLEKLLESKKFPHESRIYPGQGHRFRGDDEQDAYQRSLRFFELHLKKADG